MATLLTAHGVRLLFQDSSPEAALHLQVLGVYRYLADPALKERLGTQFERARDVFDVLLSDGRHKIKAVLAPACHELVWKSELTARSIIKVTKFKVLSEDLQDEKQKLRVVILQDVAVTSRNEDGVLPDKVVARRYGAHTDEDQLQFLSATLPREVELLPLVGERRYYLPLRSDHYTLDWACSFTGGVADEDSPLDDLVRSWSARYGAPESTQGSSDEPETAVVDWNLDPVYLSNIFTPECKKIHTVLEALEVIKATKEAASSERLYPPMIGAIRVKSKVVNIGEPDVRNPFPFVFTAVIVDATGVFEVAFFGSMCARHYLSLHEGDLVQLRGYSSVSPRELDWTMTSSPLLFFEHESAGSALHVPRKYWKILEMTKVAPHLLEVSDDIARYSQPGAGPWSLSQLRPSWLECSFVNTLNTQYWGANDLDIVHMYFDFVGVLSNVGKVCRERKRQPDEGSSDVTEFRWVKLIDSSSSHELVVKISECSQPAVFRALEAGNTLMLTKLQWTILPGAASAATRVQYATTSVFSVLRMNEAVLPFHSVEDCNLNVFFANNVRKNAVLASRKSKGESKLAAHIEKKYRPRNRLPTDVGEFKEAFGLTVCSFSDLSLLLLHMEAYELKHVGFVGQVHAVTYCEDDPTRDGASVLLQLDEGGNAERILTVAVRLNELFQRPMIKGDAKSVTPREALALVRLLPAAIVGDMVAKAAHPTSSRLSLSFIEEHLVSSKRDLFFSLQLYRDGVGHVSWEVDAVLGIE